MARTKRRVGGGVEKMMWSSGVGLLWFVVEIITYIFLEVVLTIMNLLFLTSQW